jgi:hypothetical protein
LIWPKEVTTGWSLEQKTYCKKGPVFAQTIILQRDDANNAIPSTTLNRVLGELGESRDLGQHKRQKKMSREIAQ